MDKTRGLTCGGLDGMTSCLDVVTRFVFEVGTDGGSSGKAVERRASCSLAVAFSLSRTYTFWPLALPWRELPPIVLKCKFLFEFTKNVVPSARLP